MLNGRYGPYITDKAKNARVPKDRDPKSLTLEECKELLAAAPERGRRGKKKVAKKNRRKEKGDKKESQEESEEESKEEDHQESGKEEDHQEESQEENRLSADDVF